MHPKKFFDFFLENNWSHRTMNALNAQQQKMDGVLTALKVERLSAETQKIRSREALSHLKKDYGRYNLTVCGKFEKRSISEIEITAAVLRDIFNSVDKTRRKPSYSVMLITEDHKVLTLKRVNSFHYSKVACDLTLHRSLDLRLARTLYNTEVVKLRDTIAESEYSDLIERTRPNVVRIFPGGQSRSKETIFFTLMREFAEETALKLDASKLLFNAKRVFKMLIYDFTVEKHFENYVFPIRIKMTSEDLVREIRNTKDASDPVFIDAKSEKGLFDVFAKTQRFMVG